jgi:hypothetical protein
VNTLRQWGLGNGDYFRGNPILYKIFDAESGEFVEWANTEAPFVEGEIIPLADGMAMVTKVGESEVDWENNKLFQRVEVKRQ